MRTFKKDDRILQTNDNIIASAILKQSENEVTEIIAELKAENETYKKMLDNSEFRVALTDVKTGEREVWQKLGSIHIGKCCILH